MKNITFKVLANINLATHFLDFEVLNQDGNCFELSESGYSNLAVISLSSLKSGIEWCLEGDCQDLAEFEVVRKRAIALNRFPDDLRAEVDKFLVENRWADQTPPCPFFQGKTAGLIVRLSKYYWLDEIMERLGYSSPESIWNHMISLYPAVWGKVDPRCFKKGKIGEKHRRRQEEFSKLRVFVYQNNLWITTHPIGVQGLVVCSKIGDPYQREVFTRTTTFNYKFSS